MPYRCSVVNCNGNYAAGPKVSVFKFPDDPDLKRKWLSAIARKDFVVTSNSRVSKLFYFMFFLLLR